MATKDTRRYPYTAPTQSHPSKGKGGTQSRQDASVSHKAAKGNAGPAAPKRSMAKKPKGTPIAGPGGRNIRSNTYGGGK